MSSNQAADPFFKPIGEQVSQEDGFSMQTPSGETDDGRDGGVEGSGEKHQAQDEQQTNVVESIESLCMECQQNGETRLLLTYIPYFREVIIASFYCPHCGNRNSEVQSAGTIQPKGCIYTIHVRAVDDLNRQVVKSSQATITIPELQLTIPKKRGQLTTIEGILSDTLRDLEMDQPLRKHMQPEAYTKIEEICARLRDVLGEEATTTDDRVEAAAAAASNTAEVDGGAEGQGGMRSVGPVGHLSGVGHAKDASRSFVPITFKIDDPSGNSFVEFTGDIEGRGMSDAKWSKRDYSRTKEQNVELGISHEESVAAERSSDAQAAAAAREGGSKGAAPDDVAQEARETKRSKGQDGVAVAVAAQAKDDASAGGGFNKAAGETEFDNEEVFTFPGTCSSCSAPLVTNMKKVSIPYFKDIIIMSTNCDACGYRDNEVKSGSAVPPKGRRLTLRIDDAEDLSRDILKSESAGLSIPEIDLHLAPGTLGGRFTTLEGLLQQVYDELSERVLMRGDSSVRKTNMENFLSKLKQAMSAQLCPFTLILDDPLANSYIQNPYAPDKDEQIEEVEYERTFEQNEDLGLNDMKVEDYSEESTKWRLEQEEAEAATKAGDRAMQMDEKRPA